MRFLAKIFLPLVLISFSTTALADPFPKIQLEIKCPYEGEQKATGTQSGIFCLDKKPGHWFPLKNARQLLKDVVRFKADSDLLTKTQARLEGEKAGTKLLRESLAVTGRIVDQWKNVAKTQTKRYNTLLGQKTSWTRSPYLWASIGFVAAIAVVLLSSYVLDKVGSDS